MTREEERIYLGIACEGEKSHIRKKDGTLRDSLAIHESAEIAHVVHARKKEKKRKKEGTSDCESSLGASVWRLILSYNSIPRVIPHYMDG